MPGAEDSTRILGGVLDEWRAGIDAHDPARVSALFTDDAIFQGLRPYTVGTAGVARYYDAQPSGLAVRYRILETRRPSADVVLGYLAADFSFADRDPLPLHVAVVVLRTARGWRIVSYQASSVPG
ncbi:nuclear transport factor 2 family protein [Mycobacterium sp. PS03-16]|uniref:YybH family protein n=1 Tax=Mycobacterium sp. PS03-16 TaxID=2559611 RepID=UPI001FD7899F|nr:nuclear transport factor 2 family protein [Mycobacterium sp. PS03-16]